jgi:hypothetical protein
MGRRGAPAGAVTTAAPAFGTAARRSAGSIEPQGQGARDMSAPVVDGILANRVLDACRDEIHA